MTVATNAYASLDIIFSALADPTRRAVFELLTQRPCSVGTLTDQVPVTRSAVSQHLKILKDAGLIGQAKHGQQRIYSVMKEARDALTQLSDYALTLAAPLPGASARPNAAVALEWEAVNDEVDARVVSLAGRFYVAGHRMERLFARTAATYQMNAGEAMILGTLKRLGEDGVCTPTQVGRLSLISVTGTAKRLSRLERLGLIERTSDEQDRRSVKVRLTAQGASAFEAISREQFTHNYAGFSALTPTQREGLDDVLTCLLATLPQA